MILHEAFERYIGIDYSGAETPVASLKGLRVYMADRDTPPVEVQPPAGSKKYWTRRGIAEWLAEVLSEDTPTIVGIDHGFSFPLRFDLHNRLNFVEVPGAKVVAIHSNIHRQGDRIVWQIAMRVSVELPSSA